MARIYVIIVRLLSLSPPQFRFWLITIFHIRTNRNPRVCQDTYQLFPVFLKVPLDRLSPKGRA